MDMDIRHQIAVLIPLLFLPLSAQSAETIKIAFVDPLSGYFALQGETDLHLAQASVQAINERGGVLDGAELQLVPFDDKLSAQEALLVFNQIVDSGIRFISLTVGSNVAGALSEAAAKYNSRNPAKSVLVLNLGATDPALTNEKCNFWHFRFIPTVDMQMEAFTTFIARSPSVHNVYLINQDYAYGQAVRRAAMEMLSRKRPDIKIVGDDLHPIGKVKDFAPYIAKIKTSNADTVITGNWGSHFSLLLRASKDAGLHVDYYSLGSYTAGVASTMKADGADHVKTMIPWHANVADDRLQKFYTEYKKHYSNEEISFLSIKFGFDMLARAINQAKSSEPLQIARALEVMRYQGDTGEMWMRTEDHQLAAPLYLATFTKVGDAIQHDVENTGYGWKTDVRFDAVETLLPTTCKMVRP